MRTQTDSWLEAPVRALLAARSSPQITARDRRHQPRRALDRRREALAALAEWFADQQPQPFFIVDDKLTLLLANRTGKRVLAEKTIAAIAGTRLVFPMKKLREMVERVAVRDNDEASIPVSLNGIRTVRAQRLHCPASSTGFVLICISEEPFGDPSHESLKKQFSLTRAESEIALAIYKGMSLVAIAKSRNASINTVKTQVRQIFHKCGVRSKVGLVRKVGDRKNSRSLLRGITE